MDDYKKIKTLTKAVLVTLGVSTMLLTALVAPNAIQALRPFLRRGKRKNYERERIKQAVQALKRRRLVEFIEDKEGVLVHLTQKGKQHLRVIDIDKLTLPKNEWDGRWRIIMFDIPESKGDARRAFQRKLQSLGCCPLQKSVLVYPYPCYHEIETLLGYWKVGNYVHYIETNNLDYSETRARRFFNLPL